MACSQYDEMALSDTYYEPNPSKVKTANAKPKAERLSRYGNHAKYEVNGKTYKVLHNRQDFKQLGKASWYGPNFHKQRTSSGEVYDMYQMTAAHKTLPLPSYVKVKNLENNKEVVVKVNDRGPFHNNRIIDLSYAAATKLDMLENGTASVAIEVINTDNSLAQTASWYIQTGVFSKSKSAQNMATYLKERLDDTLVKINKRKHNFVVNVGPFDNEPSLIKAKKQLKAMGILDSFTFLS